MPNDSSRLKNIVRAFRARNYRLFFTGQSISLVGTWMQQTALSWLVYHITGSPLLLGALGFASQVPSFIVAPFAGVVVDRCNRHRVLLATQSLAMMQASVLAFLVLTEAVTVWQILCLSLFLGTVNAFDMPARQSFVVQMVDEKKLLGNAIALNSSMVHIARMIGPPIAGAVIATAGEGVCFLINALSYVAVIACLLLMRVVPSAPAARAAHVLSSLKEGFVYAFGFVPIRAIILLLAFTSLMGMPYAVLMPIYAKDIFHGDSHTLGLLMGATGLGALVGAIFLASRKNAAGLGRWMVIASSALGGGIMAFSHSTVFPLSFLLLLVTGFGMMVLLTSSNTILQTIVDEGKRGRVMSLYTMAFMGTVPFGSLLQGSLASKIGAQNTLLVGGICCILGSVLFARQLPLLRQMVRPIYAKMGITRDS
ncbi:MAG TPA: MFS transporter [Syntrophobacteraceae bacterium]|nr:MFS transporter [Syntrophobacteraceae bacterium]